MDDHNPSSDRLRRLASRYEAGVGRGRAEQVAVRAITRAHRRTSAGRRLAVAVSSSAFLLVSMTGVGVAADRAIPGDFLYPLDRALEAVGLSSDLVEERLLEAITLTERGDMDQAIITANEALAELGRSGVTATLPEVATDALELTADTVEEPSTTTTDTEPPEIVPVTEVVEDAETEPVVEASAAPVTAVEALRLAAEQLLESVRTAKTDPTTSGEVTTAALFLAEATASVPATEEIDTTTSTSSTSSTTTPSSTTTTTTPADPRPGNRGGNSNESGTTTTTVASDPDDGSGSDDSTDDGEASPPGPIFLPAP